MSAPSLTTESGLSLYLRSHSIHHESVTDLTGGTANYVYRVTFPSGETAIYKHAAPYLRSNTNFAFDATRMDYEDRVLELLPPLLSVQLPTSAVHAVKWHSYDKEAKVLRIEDGGDQNLKTAYPDPALNIAFIGTELGRWLAALHVSSSKASLSLTDPQDLQANNQVGVSIYRYSYQGLHTAFSTYGSPDDVELAHRINEEYGSKLATDNECICHGDFWPGNVLLKPRDGDAGQSDKDVDLTTVDWEMTRRGTSATDVAQFAAEAFLLDRFRGGRGLLPVFLDAYIEARDKKDSVLDREWLKRVIVHWAVHIGFWPTRVQWTHGEGKEKLVKMSIGILRAILDDDWEILKASDLLKDAGANWDSIWSRA